MVIKTAVPLPTRWPELVSWPAGQNGGHLVRNHRTGETFQLAGEEHFLLGRLDGRRTSDEIRDSFEEEFGERLSEDELDEFVEQAASRGLLQLLKPASHEDGPVPAPPLERAPVAVGRRPFAKRIAGLEVCFRRDALAGGPPERGSRTH